MAKPKLSAPKRCRICGKPFTSSYPRETICVKCRHKLPKCGSCHIVMAPEHGFLDGFAKKVGRYKICGHCRIELKTKRSLHISESQYLRPSGRVKVKSVPAEDKI